MLKLNVIKVSTIEEYDQVKKIRHKVFVEEQGVPEDVEIDTYEQDSIHFLAKMAKKAIGAGRFRIKYGYLKFERIAVLSEYRGMGIGKAIMEKMQEAAAHEYPEYLPMMHAQKDSVPFYEKLGWTPVSDEFMEAGIPHKILILPPEDKNRVKQLKCLKDPKTLPQIISFLKRYE